MYSEVASTSSDLRNNKLAMSLHPVRIGPNYIIRPDDRNTCSFFSDPFANIKYSQNMVSTETQYKTMNSYQPTQKLKSYKKQTYEKTYENAKNSSPGNENIHKCGEGFCEIFSCPFCHPKNGSSKDQSKTYTIRRYEYSKNNNGMNNMYKMSNVRNLSNSNISKTISYSNNQKGICNIDSCDYCHDRNNHFGEEGFCSIKSCKYCHRNRVRTPDPKSNSQYMNSYDRNISITERNNYLNRSNITHTPDKNYYKRIIRTIEDTNNYIPPNMQAKKYIIRRRIIRTPDNSNYVNRSMIRRTEENVYRNRNTVRTPERVCYNYDIYSRTPDRNRSNYRYFSRVERNSTPDTTIHQYRSNYYNCENTVPIPDRTSFRTTYTDRSMIRREYPRTPDYIPTVRRVEYYGREMNGSGAGFKYNPTENENVYKSIKKTVVRENNYTTQPIQPLKQKKVLKSKVIKEDKNVQCSIGKTLPSKNQMNYVETTIKKSGVKTNKGTKDYNLKEVNKSKVTKTSKVNKVSNITNSKIDKLKTNKNTKIVKKDPDLLTYKVKIIRIKKKIKTNENNYLLKDIEESDNWDGAEKKGKSNNKNLLSNSTTNKKKKNDEDDIDNYNDNDDDFEDDEGDNVNYNNNDDYDDLEEEQNNKRETPTPKLKKSYRREYREYNDEHNYKDYESNNGDENDIDNEYEEKKVERTPGGNKVVTRTVHVVKKKRGGYPDDMDDDRDSDN